MDAKLIPWFTQVPKNQDVVQSVEVIKAGQVSCCVTWYCQASAKDVMEIDQKIRELTSEEQADFVAIRRAIHKPRRVRGFGGRSTTSSHPNNFRMDFRYCTPLASKRWFNVHVSTSTNPNSCALFGGIWDTLEENVEELNALVSDGVPANTPITIPNSKRRARRRIIK